MLSNTFVVEVSRGSAVGYAAGHPSGLKHMILLPTPDYAAACDPLGMVIVFQGLLISIRCSEGGLQVCGPGIDEQVRSHRPAPADASHHKVVGSELDVIPRRIGGLMKEVDEGMPTDTVETQGLVGPHVEAKFQVSIVERDVIGGVVQAVAEQVAEIAFARGSQPRTFSFRPERAFTQQFRISEADGGAEDGRRAAALASLQVQGGPNCVAIFFRIRSREQLDVLNCLAG